MASTANRFSHLGTALAHSFRNRRDCCGLTAHDIRPDSALGFVEVSPWRFEDERAPARHHVRAPCLSLGSDTQRGSLTCPVTRSRYRGRMEPIRMVSETIHAFNALSDDELVERVKHLAACERRASVALIPAYARL